MKAFVTGGTGFIGSHVVDLLIENGHSVRLFSRHADLPVMWKGKDVVPVRGDLREPDTVLEAMEGADLVFHIGEIRNMTASDAGKNAAVVKKMAAELQHIGVKRFVFVSSLTVAGIPSTVPATEETETAVVLRDQYTEYKRSAEAVIRELRNGVEHAILRPGIVYGPRSRHLGRMVNAVARIGPIGIPFIGSGKTNAPLVHVQDLARAIYLAGIRPEGANQTFNLTDGRAHTWFDLFTAIGKAQGKEVRLVPLPPVLFRLPAAFADLFAGIIGFNLDLHTYVTFLSRNVHFDMGKAKTLLGWGPEHGDLETAVREMVEWYGKQG